MTTQPSNTLPSNNLHRWLAPISSSAWQQIDHEARSVYRVRSAGRHVIDVPDEGGSTLAAVNTGHFDRTVPGTDQVRARMRQTQNLVDVRVPFTLSREQVDDVERGALDSDWDPIHDAVARLVAIEDRAILHGWSAAGMQGLSGASTNTPIPLPEDLTKVPDAVASAVTALRLADVEGPYDLVLPSELHTEISEGADHGYPIFKHIVTMLAGGQVFWSPAAEHPVVVSRRGGDASLYLGRDVSIGYLSHTAETVSLYLEESFTVLVHTAEAAIALK